MLTCAHWGEITSAGSSHHAPVLVFERRGVRYEASKGSALKVPGIHNQLNASGCFLSRRSFLVTRLPILFVRWLSQGVDCRFTPAVRLLA